MNETCWFCQRREANLSTTLVVRLRKETKTWKTAKRIEVKTETRNIGIPRCSQCASIQNKKNKIVPVLAITTVLSGLVSCLVLMSIDQHDLAIFSGFALPVILIALYFFREVNQLKRLPPEQRQDIADAQKSVLEFPAVALQLKEEGWVYAGEASEIK